MSGNMRALLKMYIFCISMLFVFLPIFFNLHSHLLIGLNIMYCLCVNNKFGNNTNFEPMATCGFPHKWSEMWSLDIFFIDSLNKLLNKLSSWQWFGNPCDCNDKKHI